jgi:hypothetical protein
LGLKAVSAAVGASAVATCTGGVALAGGINVSPSVADRGGTVTVTGRCQCDEDHPNTWVLLTSPVLVTTGDRIHHGAFRLTTTVRDRATFGRYPVTVTCNDSKHQYRASIFVFPGSKKPADPSHHHPPRPGHHQVPGPGDGPPRHYPRTGGGGMADAAEHPGLPVTGLAGAVLLAGAAGFGGVTLMRARARARAARERG